MLFSFASLGSLDIYDFRDYPETLINWDPHRTVHQPPAQRSEITRVGVEVWGLSY